MTELPQLEIIYRMMEAFAEGGGTPKSVSTAMQQGLIYVRDSLDAEAASFFMLDEKAENFTCENCLGPVDIIGLSLPVGAGIIGDVVARDDTRFIADCTKDPNFNSDVDDETGFFTRSMICAPVSGSGKQFGALQIINKSSGDGLFTEEDARLVTLLARSSALALANSEMTASIVEANKIKRDLKLAAVVQTGLFPRENHRYACGLNVPMQGVSGDLFDFVERNGHVYFCMGDVSGKGMNAALVMSKTHSIFRSLSRSSPTPAELVASINRELIETSDNGMFVTAIIGTYNPDTNQLLVCNAGHEPGLVAGPEGVDYIKPHLHPMGIMETAAEDIAQSQIDLTNARFFAYSDGLTETEINGTAIGTENLAGMIAAHQSIGLPKQLDLVMQEIRQKADRIFDDLTILGIGK